MYISAQFHFYSNALPASDLFIFPERSRSSYNPNTEMEETRQSEIISNRPTSDFNRLVFNRISHSLHSESPQEYIDYDDEPEKLSNSLSPDGNSELDNQPTAASESTPIKFDQTVISGEAEGRHFVQVHHKKKKKKKKPCIPYKPKYGRTYPNLNVVFVDVNYNGVNDYNTNGGYNCHPAYGNGGIGSHLGGLFAHGAHGTQVTVDGQSEDESVNSHGSLLGSGGSGISNPAHTGGPFGFFGQGGLFDFSAGNVGSSSGIRPQVDDPYTYSDTVKPVIEINVPDSIQDAVNGNWRPGEVVGGIQNAVTGFVQQIVNQPNETIRQLNREIYSFLEPITSLFV